MKEKIIPFALSLSLSLGSCQKESPRTYDYLSSSFKLGNNTLRLATQIHNSDTYTVYLINALDPQGQPIAAWQIADTDHDGPENTARLILDLQNRIGTFDPGFPDIVTRVFSPQPRLRTRTQSL